MVHSNSFGWDPHVLYEKQQQKKPTTSSVFLMCFYLHLRSVTISSSKHILEMDS